MINSIFFASEKEQFPDLPELRLGYGFTPEGRWRSRPLPRSGALALDDRYPPGPAGLREALAALSGWTGLIVCDFERPPSPWALRLLQQLEGRDTAVPPAYRACPHRWVLMGPYRPGQSFSRWLAEGLARFGPVILDGAPIRHRARPGRPPTRWSGPLPEAGFPCPGAGCLCRRTEDGAFLFWDSRATLLARLKAAGVPAVVLAPEWDALPAGGNE